MLVYLFFASCFDCRTKIVLSPQGQCLNFVVGSFILYALLLLIFIMYVYSSNATSNTDFKTVGIKNHIKDETSVRNS